MKTYFRWKFSTVGHPNTARAGFTLIEILVALAIFSVLLTIIFVPLNQGVRFTQIGTARADTQQAAQTTMNRIVGELRQAVFVFPNERMAGITDQAPYNTNKPAAEILGYPYYQGDTGTPCAGLAPAENTGRLDFLLPRSNEITALNDAARGKRRQSGHSIVTFYARRINTAQPYSEDNTIGLFRARIPSLRNDAADFLDADNGNAPNALMDDKRYPGACSTSVAAVNSGARWLVQNSVGEPQLDWVANPSQVNNDNLVVNNFTDPTYAAGTVPASNALITPQGADLYAPQSAATPPNYQPETSFICEDTNGNGIIDRVTVTLVMGKFDSAGASSRAQTVRLTQTVDLPNTESRFSNPIS